MSIDRQWELLIIPEIAFAFVIPAALFALGRRWIHCSFIRLVVVVGLVWLARNLFRIFVALPICLKHAHLHGDDDYDGVGGNVAVLFAGWLEPLLTCLVVIAVTATVRRLRRSPTQRPDATTGIA